MSVPFPESMQAVQLDKYGGALKVVQIPVPKPGPQEVLIRMAASPINPSDLGFLRGGYSEKPLPVVPGIEGSGTVVVAGPGLLPRFLMGKRVACTASTKSNGTWAEYMVTSASLCVPLHKNISLEQGAMLFVNPLTALAFFEIIKKGKHAAVVNTAAASQLGRMIVRLGLKHGVPVINIVRRKEQADLLYALGAKHVLNSSDADFDQKLRTLTHQLKATLILDAVAGEFTQQLINAAPHGSLILIYSYLSWEPARINPNTLWFDERRIEGFHLVTWARKKSFLQILRTTQQVQNLANTDLKTTIYKRFPLSAIEEALGLYEKNMTAGKILLVIDPNGVSTN
jgi:NADPH:quinone reductase